MQFAGILTIAAQIYFGVHAYKKGKTLWIFLIIFLPIIGIGIYFFVEYLPEMQDSELADSAKSNVESFFFPEKELKARQDDFAYAPNHANRMALAEAYQKSGKFEEALELYVPVAKGLYADDPAIWAGIGHANFHMGNYEAVVEALQKRRVLRKDIRPDDFDLLLPRALEALDRKSEALDLYVYLAKAYSGEEARYRYGQLLIDTGQPELARDIFEEMIKHANLSPTHYRKAQAQWIGKAKKFVVQ
ncbi:MAG: PLDc N-terminal domain-containing protein [Bacteroidia bacterium]